LGRKRDSNARDEDGGVDSVEPREIPEAIAIEGEGLATTEGGGVESGCKGDLGVERGEFFAAQDLRDRGEVELETPLSRTAVTGDGCATGHASAGSTRTGEEGMLNEGIQVEGGGARVMVVGDSMLILVSETKNESAERGAVGGVVGSSSARILALAEPSTNKHFTAAPGFEGLLR